MYLKNLKKEKTKHIQYIIQLFTELNLKFNEELEVMTMNHLDSSSIYYISHETEKMLVKKQGKEALEIFVKDIEDNGLKEVGNG